MIIELYLVGERVVRNLLLHLRWRRLRDSPFAADMAPRMGNIGAGERPLDRVLFKIGTINRKRAIGRLWKLFPTGLKGIEL